MSNNLNAAQRTALVVTLSQFERSLRQAAVWLDGDETQGVMHRATLALPPVQQKAALAAIHRAFELIAQLAERFGLEPTHEPLAGRISADMTVSWANLVDARSAKLKRYGAVDPALGEALDPDLDRLSRLALMISAIVSGIQEVRDE